jgi:hypothetical protein
MAAHQPTPGSQLDVMSLLLQAGVATDRLLAVLDCNGDLYLMRRLHSSSTGFSAAAAAARPVTDSSTVAGVITAGGLVAQGAASQQQQQQRRLVKLATNVTSPPVWHDAAPMLAAVVDGQLVVWYYPGAAYVDQQLLQATRCVISTDRCDERGYGRQPRVCVISALGLEHHHTGRQSRAQYMVMCALAAAVRNCQCDEAF